MLRLLFDGTNIFWFYSYQESPELTTHLYWKLRSISVSFEKKGNHKSAKPLQVSVSKRENGSVHIHIAWMKFHEVHVYVKRKGIWLEGSNSTNLLLFRPYESYNFCDLEKVPNCLKMTEFVGIKNLHKISSVLFVMRLKRASVEFHSILNLP